MLLVVLDSGRQVEVKAVFINKLIGTVWWQHDRKVGVGMCQVTGSSLMNGSNVVGD